MKNITYTCDNPLFSGALARRYYSHVIINDTVEGITRDNNTTVKYMDICMDCVVANKILLKPNQGISKEKDAQF